MTSPEEITNEYMRELLSTLSHFIPTNEQVLRNDVIDVIINLREGEVNMVPNAGLGANFQQGDECGHKYYFNYMRDCHGDKRLHGASEFVGI